MTMTRRDVGLQLLIASILATGALGAAEGVAAASSHIPLPWDHPIFATSRIAGAEWRQVPLPKPDFSNAASVGPTNIGLEAEIHAVLLQEVVSRVEQNWLVPVRKQAPVFGTYRPNSDGTSDRGRDGRLTSLLLASAQGMDNIAIVSPVALTVLQAEGETVLLPPDMASGPQIGMRAYARLENITLVVDAYANEDTPVLVGHVPSDPAKRLGALIWTRPSELAWGTKPGHDDPQAWRAIGLDIDWIKQI